MSHDTALFTINPLFYDALSGEFTPASDPERHRTLGRLASDTFHRSKLVELRGESNRGDSLYDLSYSPFWAPGVTATILCLEKDNRARVKGLLVRRGDDLSPHNRIGFSDDPRAGQEEGRLRIIKPGSGKDEYLDLILEDDRMAAKQAVTVLAQKFFSRDT